MRYSITTIYITSIFFSISCSYKPSLEELRGFAATELYPEDGFLDTVSIKKALIVVAHDDDDCAMSGTIAKLTAKGWQVKQPCLVAHPLMDGTGQNPAGIICQGNEPIIADGHYRIGLDTIKAPYLPISYVEINKQFLTDKVAAGLTIKINNFNPSVIFTLDNIKGGYGHPDHIFISQLVLDLLFNSEKIATKRIYQSVYTDHMEKEIVDTWLKVKMDKYDLPHPSTISNELYGIDGMPEPNVQVTITDQKARKMDYLRAYPENVKKNLRKFLPYYEEFNAETYFSIFDREFFRVMERTTPVVKSVTSLQVD